MAAGVGGGPGGGGVCVGGGGGRCCTNSRNGPTWDNPNFFIFSIEMYFY